MSKGKIYNSHQISYVDIIVNQSENYLDKHFPAPNTPKHILCGDYNFQDISTLPNGFELHHHLNCNQSE